MDIEHELNTETFYDIDYIIKHVSSYYHPSSWDIYKDLLDTRYCPEKYEFYDWSDINNHSLFQNIFNYKRNFIENFDNVISIVREIIIDMYDGPQFNKYGELFTINYWVLEGLEHCNGCGRIWDGCAQCDCYMYD